jgi:hypothetical protein
MTVRRYTNADMPQGLDLRRAFSFNRRPGERNNRGRIATGAGVSSPVSAVTPLTIAAANGVSLWSWHRSDVGVMPSGQMFQYAGTTNVPVFLAGSSAAVYGITIKVDDVTGGTASGQAKFSVYTDGGTTPIASGLTTSPVSVALPGVLDGVNAVFQAGTYSNDNVYRAGAQGWEDQTGNGNDLLQDTYALAPLLMTTGAYAGKPAIYCDGTRWMRNPTLGALASGVNTALTVVSVFRSTNAATSNIVWNFGKFNDNAKSLMELQVSSAGTNHVYNRWSDANVLRQRQSPAASHNSLPQRHLLTYAGTATTLNINGSSVALTGTDWNQGTQLTLSYFTIGGRHGSSFTAGQASEHYEYIIWPGVNAQMNTDIISYLNSRYS